MPRFLAFLFLTAVFPLASPAQPGAGQAQAKPGEAGAVSGWVVNTATEKPLERATVLLVPAGGATGMLVMNGVMISQTGGGTTLTAVTNAEGRFAFPTVEPGNYSIAAARAGFAVVADTALQSSGGRVNVTVTSGAKVTDLKLRLTPAAVISGRVTDEEGDPQPGVSVRLMHPVYAHGQRQLQRIEAINSVSNDRGEFRIHDLLPGRYVLVATGGNNGSAFDRYFPAFYPSGTDASAATLLDIKAGTQLHDMNLILLPAKMTRMRGRVIEAATNQPAANAGVQRSPRGSAFNSASTVRASTNAQGEWEFADLRPGPQALDADLSQGQERLVARIEVEVPPGGLDDVRLLLNPGAEFAGTVRVECAQGRPDFDPSKLRVVLTAQEYDAGVSNGAVTPQGAFTVRNVRPATYDASVTPLPDTLYLKSVQFERQEAINTGFEVAGPGSFHLDLALGGDAAQLEGTVKDSEGKPSSGVTVLLVPADPAQRKMQRLHKTATTTHEGKYILKGIPPGGYLVYSWAEVDPGIWFEADFLPRYEAKAVSVSLAANQRATTELKLLTVVEAPEP